MTDHFQVKMAEKNYEADRPKAKNPVKIMDLTLRDGYQSLFATRGRTEDMIAVADMMDNIGFWAVEVWGGATFDTMHRFLNEDPWERLRTMKRYFKKTPLSMLLRAQNLVGYRNYPDDVAKAFVQRTAENGMDVFRTFDALNDYRNFETVVKEIKAAGKHFQGCVCYTLTEPRMGGEIYNLEFYLKKAKELEDMGADTICIKDMAGLLSPYDAFDLVKALKETVKPPIHLHSHFTSGMSPMTHLKAIEAGVDIIDTCMCPFAYRTSHAAIEPLVVTLYGTDRDTGFSVQALDEINIKLEKDILPKYKHLLDDSKVSIIDTNVLLHQTPGGMLSNLVNQLREMDALDRINEVYELLPKVRKDLGQVPLVTPTSQIVGIQTVNNVLFDDENDTYKMTTQQVKDLCYGLYGKTATPINPEVQKKVLKGYPRGEEPITCRPAEILEPELEKAKEDVKGLAVDLDDVLIYALYPTTGKKFLRYKYGLEEPPEALKPKTLAQARQEEELVQKAKAGQVVLKKKPEDDEGMRKFTVMVDDELFEVAVEDKNPPVFVQAAPVSPQAPSPAPQQQQAAPARQAEAAAPRPAPQAAPAVKPAETPAPPAAAPAAGTPIKAPMPGTVIRFLKKVGEPVNEGDTVVILEAMKMENSLTSAVSGTLLSVNMREGDSVAKNDVICTVG